MKQKKTVPRIALLTNCTNSSNFPPLIRIEDAPKVETMDELCAWWVLQHREALKKHPKEARTPGALYKGLSFDTVIEIAQEIGHENVLVVNRGAGLVRFTDKMIPYNFTFDKEDRQSARYKVLGEKFIPALWWSKVNYALYGNAFPISTIKTPNGEDYDYFITSLSSEFINLISADLLMISNRDNRLYMPLSRSGVSSVSRDLQYSCVPYTTAYTDGLHYNRNNKAHKVTQKFMKQAFLHGDIAAYTDTLRDEITINASIKSTVSYADMFKQYPELLESPTPDGAMFRAKSLGLNTGSATKFTGAWRGTKGQLKVAVTKTEMTKSRSALQQVMVGMMQNAPQDDEHILHEIGLFVMTVKEECPSLIFTAKDIAAWGNITYGEKPVGTDYIGNHTRVRSLLRTNATFLGVEVVGTSSPPVYRLIPKMDGRKVK